MRNFSPLKSFIVVFIRFALPVVLIAAAIVPWAILVTRWDYRRHIRLSENVRFVAVGDSEPELSMDPEELPGMVNQAVTACPLDCLLYKVQDLVAVNHDRRFTLIINISPRRLADKIKPLEPEDFASRYAPLYFLHIGDPYCKMGSPFLLFRDRVLSEAFHAMTGNKLRKKSKNPNKRITRVWGGFQRFADALFLSNPESAEKQTNEYLDTLEDVMSANPNFSANLPILDKILSTIAASGNKAVLTCSPWHHSLTEKIPGERLRKYRDVMSELAKVHGVEWFDDLELDLPDSCFFNQNHLNQEGARTYTSLMRARLDR